MNWYIQTADGKGVELVDAYGNEVPSIIGALNKISCYSPNYRDDIPVRVESRGEHFFGYIKTESRDCYGRLGYAIFHALRTELMQLDAKDYLMGLKGLHAQFSDVNKQLLQQKIVSELAGKHGSLGKMLALFLAVALGIVFILMMVVK